MPEFHQNVLLVEDDRPIRMAIQEALETSGYSVTPCCLVADARKQDSAKFDLALLDIGLPDGSGFDLCREIRFLDPCFPIIFVSARDEPEDVVEGLDLGADDYLVKPFTTVELLARVRSVLRRASREREDERIVFGELWADVCGRQAGVGAKLLDLKPRELDLLVFFMRSPGRVWTRLQLLDRVWEVDFKGDERTVDVHIARLRAAMEENPRDPQWIETVWRTGYRFRECDS
jgi:DNA-binding response OmpR family regulator